jgi:hypothetical protein
MKHNFSILATVLCSFIWELFALIDMASDNRNVHGLPMSWFFPYLSGIMWSASTIFAAFLLSRASLRLASRSVPADAKPQ